MATLPELEQALKIAYDRGMMDKARKLAVVVNAERQKRAETIAETPEAQYFNQLPDWEEPTVAGTVPQPEEPGLIDTAIGTADAAATAATAATSGNVGMLGGTLYGIANELMNGQFGTDAAAKRINQEAFKGMQRFTRAPRTESGGEQLQAVGEFGEALIPLAPMGAELGMMARSAATVAPAARVGVNAVQQAARETASQVKPVITQAVQSVRERLPTKSGDGFGDDTAGAARLDRPAIERARAQELDVPIDLMKGQQTGKTLDIKTERELAKGEGGEALRDRYAQQNAAVQDNFEVWQGQTGSELTDLGPIGERILNVLEKRKQKDVDKEHVLYNVARKSEEAKRPAPASTKVEIELGGEPRQISIVDYMNSRPKRTATSKVMDKARTYGEELGVIQRNDDGTYTAVPGATVHKMEDWRVEIQEGLPSNPTPTEIREATILKKMIDQTTEPVAGPLFKRARQQREKNFKDYERNYVTAKLLGTKKGSDDRAIAVEDVVRKVVLDPSTSVEQMRHIRRLLQTKTGGKDGEGVQSWKEIQGATLRHIQERVKRLQQDDSGGRTMSASNLNKIVTQLDERGKLDFIFGKQGADKIRTINEVVQAIENAPPGAVNYSNTSTALLAAIDMMVSATSGIPAPALTILNQVAKKLKNEKLKKKIQEHLNYGL